MARTRRDNATTQVSAPVTALQSRFSIVTLGGELRIVDNDEIATAIRGTRAACVAFYKKLDGEALMKRHLHTLSVSVDRKQALSDFWLNPKTHVYDAVAFSPLPTSASTINYWIGPTVSAKEGDWTPIKAFLREVICGNDARTYDYLVRYIAHMLQRPDEKPGIMVVMLGAQGTGKGAFFALLRKIWSRTTLQVSDVDQVVGRFNAALERHYVVCMDEALFSGDKRAVERLKSLITEPVCRIEQKYQPGRTIDSYHRFFASSNNDHFAHIDYDDRRFLFLRVSSAQQGNAAYWTRLFKCFDDESSVAAMVHELKHLDLSRFNVRQRPRTDEHLGQKLKSLSGFERFWFEMLQTGLTNPGGLSQESWKAPMFVATQTLIRHFKEFDRNAERFRTVQTHQIATTLRKLCPSAMATRTKAGSQAQHRGYELPSIDIARREFEQTIGGAIPWPDAVTQNQTLFPKWEIEAMWETYHLEDGLA